MSTIEPGEELIADDELQGLLQCWTAESPKSLDQRVANSYHREFGRADAAVNPAPFSVRQKEEVTMKFCSTCQEEYADKFSFCPVDGTPLNGFVRRNEETATVPAQDRRNTLPTNPPVVRQPVYAAAAHAAPSIRGEYHLTIMDDAGLVSRLAHELKDVAHEYELTWPEFKRDPFGFTKRSIVGYGQMVGRFFGNRNVLIAMSAAVLAMVVLVAAVAFLDKSNSTGSSRIGLIIFTLIAFGGMVGTFATWLGRERGAAVMGAEASDSRNVVFAMVSAFVFLFAIMGGVFLLDRRQQAKELAQVSEDTPIVEQIFDIPDEQPTPDPGPAGFNKGSGGGSKPKQERPGGGGGGGRQEQTPASAGKLPQASLTVPQILPPDPKPPVVKNPALPVAATVVADPLLVPPDVRVLPYGDPKSKSTTPSSGGGKGNGIGEGEGTGVGPGQGAGIGPGRGGNIGGGDYREGGGGPGGGGGGDYNRIFSGKDVTSKARVLSKPEPQYTEEARKNQIVGTVVLRAVFSSSGQVTNIRAVSGLPYGLTDRAIAAARQIKFVPATKDGHQVSMWMQLEYNFNLY
ncbi:MAG TPA: energy transducer TonB [Pyrinomonadaceae bacterium]|nr:energy transducer TonB [Pyrinomonadaceae bacterium]